MFVAGYVIPGNFSRNLCRKKNCETSCNVTSCNNIWRKDLRSNCPQTLDKFPLIFQCIQHEQILDLSNQFTEEWNLMMSLQKYKQIFSKDSSRRNFGKFCHIYKQNYKLCQRKFT